MRNQRQEPVATAARDQKTAPDSWSVPKPKMVMNGRQKYDKMTAPIAQTELFSAEELRDSEMRAARRKA